MLAEMTIKQGAEVARAGSLGVRVAHPGHVGHSAAACERGEGQGHDCRECCERGELETHVDLLGRVRVHASFAHVKDLVRSKLERHPSTQLGCRCSTARQLEVEPTSCAL